jgi:hypothetical protein
MASSDTGYVLINSQMLDTLSKIKDLPRDSSATEEVFGGVWTIAGVPASEYNALDNDISTFV